MSPKTRDELHASAAALVAALAEVDDEDLRTVVSYYRSCLAGADRAAEQLVAFVEARGFVSP
jgi:hypothetical protein